MLNVKRKVAYKFDRWLRLTRLGRAAHSAVALAVFVVIFPFMVWGDR